MAKHARRRSQNQIIARLSVALIAFAFLVPLGQPGQAASIFDAEGVSFDFNIANAVNVVGTGTTSGDIVRYRNVATIDGQSIDAVVQTGPQTGSVINAYDNPGGAESNSTIARPYFQVDVNLSSRGRSEFIFSFYEADTYSGPNTGQQVILRNVTVTSIDLDLGQYTEFSGFSTYRLADADPSPYASRLQAYTTDDQGAALATGLTRFTQIRGATVSSNNNPQDAVEVKFNQITTFRAVFGHEGSGISFFGINFAPLCDTVDDSNGCLTGYAAIAPQNNPANSLPVSTNDQRNVETGVATALLEDDFGSYSDADNQPLSSVVITAIPTTGSLEVFDGTNWVSVNANDSISVDVIRAGHLRFTGSADDSLSFKVSDGSAGSISTSAYVLTLNVRSQGQVITFANPGTKLPTDSAFASNATSDSGLSVSLTSLTTGVCTVSGTDIDPVSSGMCTVVASQPGDTTFAAALSVTQTFPVSSLAPQVITFANPGTQNYSGTPITITSTPSSDSSLSVSLASLTPNVCTVSGATITVAAAGICQIRATQPGNGTYAPAVPVTQSFVVTSVATFTITYDGNSEDSGSAPASQTGSGSVVLATNSGNLVKSGYTFGGWTIGGTTYAAGASYNLAGNVTATAIWTAVVVSNPAGPVQYPLNFAAPTSTSGQVPNSQIGNVISIPGNTGNLVRAGFFFGGWTIDGVDYPIGSSYTLTGSKTAYAYWIPKSIKFLDPTTEEEILDAKTQLDEVVLPSLGTNVKPGYSLVGWKIGDVEHAPGSIIAVDGLLTASAIWAVSEPEVLTQVDGEELADTGFETSNWLIVALLLLGLGTASVLYARRRD